MIINFSPGPGLLVPKIRNSLSKVLLDPKSNYLFQPAHLQANEDLWKQACLALRKFDFIPDDFEIILMPVSVRGMYTLFAEQIPQGKTVGVYQTGYWSYCLWKALSEHHRVRLLSPFFNSALSTEESTADYSFSVSNETISGFQCFINPGKKTMHIVDKTSDFLSSPTDWSTLDCAFIGCQKVFSFPGATLVVARKTFLSSLVKKKNAHHLFYQFEQKSKASTRSNLHVWLIKEVTEVLAKKGWPFLKQRREIWVNTLYTLIDKSIFFKNDLPEIYRSNVQVTFTCQKHFEKKLEDFFKENQCIGYTGHIRYGKGYRLSLYPSFIATYSFSFLDKFLRFCQQHDKKMKSLELMLE
jgi:phosphoserine aminotransferase